MWILAACIKYDIICALIYLYVRTCAREGNRLILSAPLDIGGIGMTSTYPRRKPNTHGSKSDSILRVRMQRAKAHCATVGKVVKNSNPSQANFCVKVIFSQIFHFHDTVVILAQLPVETPLLLDAIKAVWLFSALTSSVCGAFTWKIDQPSITLGFEQLKLWHRQRRRSKINHTLWYQVQRHALHYSRGSFYKPAKILFAEAILNCWFDWETSKNRLCVVFSATFCGSTLLLIRINYK